MSDPARGPACTECCGEGFVDLGTLSRARSTAPAMSIDPGVVRTHDQIRRALEPYLGTCDFYRLLSDMTPGDREKGYYWNYGYKYCKRFRESDLANDPKAARWIDCVMVNLQREVLKTCVPLGHDLEAIKKAAYASHASVYANCGICELDKTFIQQFRVLFVPDSDDLWTELGLQQIKQALAMCFFRPWYFDGFIQRYESWGDLDEARLGGELAARALDNPAANHKVLLGIMEMLSNTLDDDDVAEEFCKALSDEQLQTIAQTDDGRRILFMMQSALESGMVFKSERRQLDRLTGLTGR